MFLSHDALHPPSSQLVVLLQRDELVGATASGWRLCCAECCSRVRLKASHQAGAARASNNSRAGSAVGAHATLCMPDGECKRQRVHCTKNCAGRKTKMR